MARRTFLDYLDNQGVLIAVRINTGNMLHIPARLTLSPEFLTAAAVKTGFLLTKADLQTLLIHPGHHQNLFAIMILHNRRNQTFLIKL